MEFKELIEERHSLQEKRREYIQQRNEFNKKIVVANAKLQALESQIKRASQKDVGKRIKQVMR